MFISCDCIHCLGYICILFISLDASHRVYISIACYQSKIVYFSLFLFFIVLNGHKGSLKYIFLGHQSSTNIKSLFHLNIKFHYFLSQFPNPPSLLLHIISFIPTSYLKAPKSDTLSLICSFSFDTDFTVINE